MTEDSGTERPEAHGLAAGRLISLLARNARALAAAGVVTRLSAVVAAIILARGLGEHEFGGYVIAVAFASIFGILVEFGTGGYLVREAAQKPQLLGRTTGLVLSLRAGLGILMVVIAFSLPPVLGYEHSTSLAIGLFTTAAALRAIGTTFLSALQALERLGDVATVQAQQTLLGAAATALTIALGGELVAVSWVAVAVAALALPWSWRRLHAAGHGRVELQRGLMRGALPAIAGFSSILLFSTGITYLDSLLVHAFKGETATGLYGAAYRVLLALYFIPTVYSTSVIRSMSRLASRDRDMVGWLYSRVFCHLTVAALPIAVFGFVGSRSLLELLYGQPYGDADTALALLLASVVFTFPAWIASTTAYAVGAERRIVAIVAASLTLNVIANLLAIPPWGIEGAGAANLATEGLTLGLLLVLLRRKDVRLDWTSAVSKPLIAIAPSVLIVFLLAGAPLAFRLTLGAGVYVAGLFLLRTFDSHDYAFLRALGSIGRNPVKVGGDELNAS
jgi:O-antigen/teichoic acid export membrane protein